MTIVIYKNGKKPKNSWISYLLLRIKNNKNNLIVFVGQTGSGKSWGGLSVGEMMSKENKIPFGIDNIVFSLKELMQLINSGKLKKGSVILFDEPQISISAREFQSQANRVFNYLLTTFRHRNFTLLFATPYEDLLDKTSRKMFHAKFTTMKINKEEKKVIVKPVELQYNSHKQKFYEKFLRVSFKPEGRRHNQVSPLSWWGIPKPSDEIIKLYEEKKYKFTTELNENIQLQLESYEQKQKESYNIKDTRKPLTDKQRDVLRLMKQYGDVEKVMESLDMAKATIYFHITQARKKGYEIKDDL